MDLQQAVVAWFILNVVLCELCNFGGLCVYTVTCSSTAQFSDRVVFSALTPLLLVFTRWWSGTKRLMIQTGLTAVLTGFLVSTPLSV